MKTRISLFLSVFLLSFFNSIGQITNLGQPKSWSLKAGVTPISSINMPPFDEVSYRAEDSINDLYKVGPWRFGYKHQVSYTLENSGEWTILPNGDRIWQLRVKSKDAISMNFIFQDLFIPNGASIHLLKPDHSGYLGAYTSINNNVEKILGTDLISGEDIIIEYFEPYAVTGQGTLMVTDIVHGYRDVSLHENEVMKGLNDSYDCNRDVRCLTDPEPLWLDESNSVAMIVVNGNGSCTGTLVNNTAQDGTPYFLTADHCLGNPATWAFRFKWISPNPVCATTANSTNTANPTQFQTANGATLRASNDGSDFALVQINNLTLATAQAWGLFYAGWDHTGSPVTSAIGIHHPSGDIMKYARENNNLVQETWSGAQCWRVSNWDEGVTEPGSSGSGLWDNNHRLIGQLYGGGAACSGTNDNNQPDWYGRFDISWNGASAATRLHDWLDPSGISTGTLDGWNPNQPTVALDAGIQGINNPAGILCSTGDFTPEVILRNFGSTTLTTVDIEYSIDGGATSTYSWSGSLASNNTVTVTLPAQSATNGAHTFEASTTNPNGGTDENLANDGQVANFEAILNGQLIDFVLETDCYGSEVEWTVEDGSSNVIYQGGPYSDVTGGETITEEWCLSTDCFTFTITDEYGDGMHGSQWTGCSIDGSYTITQDGTTLAETIATDADYGDDEVNPFCVLSSVTADFEADDASICAGQSVNFTDLSLGTITEWEWTFPGGSPTTSATQNPVVTYVNAGTYDVTLTVSDGVNDETVTFTNYITVNALPAIPTITPSGSTSICAGSSVNLTSSYPSGNVWSTTETSASISVNSTGGYSVTYTDGNGCSSTSATTNVTVNPVPTISMGTVVDPSVCGTATGSIQVLGSGSGIVNWTGTATGNSGTITLPYTISSVAAGAYNITFTSAAGCTSGNINQTLTDPTPPTTPTITPSGATTFCAGGSVSLTSSYGSGNTWSTSATSNSINVTTSGTYSVTYTDGSGCSSSSAPVVVTVNTNPSAPVITPSGATTFCDGGSIDLTSSQGSGNTWSTSATSNSINVTSSGNYTVTYTDGNGCSATSGTTVITVNANPAAPTITPSGATTFCADGNVNLTSSEAGGNTWSTSETSNSINVTSSGNYTVTYTDGNGCSATSGTTVVTVNPTPSVSITPLSTVCVYHNPSTLSGGSPAGGTYSGTGVTGGNFDPSAAGQGTHPITYTYIDGNGCQGMATANITVDGCASLVENELNGVSVYPNPTENKLFIVFDGDFKFEILDTRGRIIEGGNSTSSIELNTSNYTSGVYFVKVTSDSLNATIRVVKN